MKMHANVPICLHASCMHVACMPACMIHACSAGMHSLEGEPAPFLSSYFPDGVGLSPTINNWKQNDATSTGRI